MTVKDFLALREEITSPEQQIAHAAAALHISEDRAGYARKNDLAKCVVSEKKLIELARLLEQDPIRVEDTWKKGLCPHGVYAAAVYINEHVPKEES